MRLGLWRIAPLGASSAQTTWACLATSMPTTQRISGGNMLHPPFTVLPVWQAPDLLAAVPSSMGAHPQTDGAAVRPSTVRTQEAGTGGFFGRSSLPMGGPQTVTCQRLGIGFSSAHNIRGGRIPDVLFASWTAPALQAEHR